MLNAVRQSFASHFYQQSHDLVALQKLLGHANISTTMIYVRHEVEGHEHVNAIAQLA